MIDGQTDGWADRRIDGQTDGQMVMIAIPLPNLVFGEGNKSKKKFMKFAKNWHGCLG